MRSLLLLSLLLANPQPAEPKPEPTTIQVGEKRELRVHASRGKCDDPSVVRVESAGEWMEIVGLEEGITRCSLYAGKGAKPVRLYQVTVVTPMVQ